MTAPVFVDTNVLIYAVDLADPRKQRAAQSWLDELWKSKMGRLSFQVLQEFYVKVSQKRLSTVDNARAEIRDLLTWKPVPVTAGLLEQGWKIQDRYRLSFWDSLIVAAAKAASCRFLLTEDLQCGQDFDGLLAINPFLTDPAPVATRERHPLPAPASLGLVKAFCGCLLKNVQHVLRRSQPDRPAGHKTQRTRPQFFRLLHYRT
jgi:predicted nucleic acid-binding protein